MSKNPPPLEPWQLADISVMYVWASKLGRDGKLPPIIGRRNRPVKEKTDGPTEES